ncbi:MAG TPA: NAD(P)-binding domain-containing protein [Blastocatellia bacterium]|nr:NAD(P)-binding domain-containing protein [Blastocatellia bacterium]
MASKNRFLIKRRDKDQGVDDVVVETEGLTIGRLIGNDLVLNHRSVSRTHAGIKQIAGDFWLFNLSTSNGTLLNGELAEKGPLADGDVIQVGPFVIIVNYLQAALSLLVERELEVIPLESRSSAPLGDATVMIKVPSAARQKVVTPGGSVREQGTGLFTTMLPGLDQGALDVFWEKRKREAGKIGAKTALHPHGSRKVGKAQFNWYPTLDLRKLWRKSYFSWGIIIAAVLSLGAFFAYERAYSPGEISAAHSATQLSARGIALTSNDASCASCHGVSPPIEQRCASCHTTSKFQPSIYDSHAREQVGCTSCHTEHSGPESQAGLISYGLCSSCHNDTYKIKSGERAGEALGIPHGGSVGYPVQGGKWVWDGLSPERLKRKNLPEAWAKNSPKDQFHLVHQKGRMQGRTLCGDCHTGGSRGDERWRTSPRNECAKCHGISFTASGLRRGLANCNTCHQQHGQSTDAARLVPPAGTDATKLKKFLTSLEAGEDANEDREGENLAAGAKSPLVLATGGAHAIRQERITPIGMLRSFGGAPWYAWAGVAAVVPLVALAVMAAGTARRKRWLRTTKVEPSAEVPKPPTGSIDLEKVKAEGPPFPHPVIDPVLCIGCHACVEACPHDVLTIVNGIATAASPEQCMEDTSCQVECPTNPKACIVINTNKVIPPRKVPARDQRLMTNIEGVYMIGDVSGVPLIKNAVNEGSQVIDCVIESLTSEGPEAGADFDIAIIGIGPAGLSAAVIAKQRGLSYIAIEQDKVVSTIQNYPAGKYVFYKPDTVEGKGGIPIPGAGQKREEVLAAWIGAMTSTGVEVQEEESCTAVKRENGVFAVTTEKGKLKQKSVYKARYVILAIGNRGTPMKLRVPGEEIKMLVQPEPVLGKHCTKCGTARREAQTFCVKCGTHFPLKPVAPYEDSKVKYKLTDPDDYSGKKCIVVGAGNSAIEAAVDLAGFKREGESFTFTRDNEVTLVIRSDFKGDLKLGNKINVYDCIDAGRIKVYFRTEIKEITEHEAVLMDVRTKEQKARVLNDYVFAMIGGERPTKFLEGIGIKIG